MLYPDLHNFVFCFGFGKTKTAVFVLERYFDLSKSEVFVLVLPKPKQNCAGRLVPMRLLLANAQTFAIPVIT